jgi:hypothetical protein
MKMHLADYEIHPTGFKCIENNISGFGCYFYFCAPNNQLTMWSDIWNFIGKMFQAVFSLLPSMGLWFNKLLIVVAFIAFFLWLNYMSKQKEVEKFD